MGVSSSPPSSPVIDEAYNRRRLEENKIRFKHQGFTFAAIAAVLYIDLVYGSSILQLIVTASLGWYVECACIALCVLVCVYDLLLYLSCHWSMHIVQVTHKQKSLLGIKDSAKGFSVISTSPHTSPTTQLVFSPCATPSAPLTTSTHHHTPSLFSPYSPHQSHTGGGAGGFEGLLGSGNLSCAPSPSQSYVHAVSGLFSPSSPSSGTGYMSANQSSDVASLSFTSGSPIVAGAAGAGASPYRAQQATGASYTGLRNRSANTTAHDISTASLASTVPYSDRSHNYSQSSDGCLSNLSELDSFLKEQQDKEHKMMLANDTSPNTSGAHGSSFWSYSRQLGDYSCMLSRSHYQASCSSPKTTAQQGNDGADDNTKTTYNSQQVWTKLGVHEDVLALWVERLRKWIGQTVMHRLAAEITKINSTLVSLGCEDMQIGELSISNLKHIAASKSQHIPTLNDLIPFLEVSATQQYVIKRIMELSSGGCIGAYNWDGGSDYKGKPWAQHLPTDATIIMHVLCTYMDMHLPPDPKHPDNKVFTNEHFLKTPDKPDSASHNLLLYQSKMNPPEFKVIADDVTWAPPKGRNNLFHALLVFLYQVKHKHKGMLGRVNLGLSGINILFVIDE